MRTDTETMTNHLRSLGWPIFSRILVALGAAMLWLGFTGTAVAQAPPGPIGGAPDTSERPVKMSSKGGSPESNKYKLAGEWKLNKSLSDDPRQRMEQATGASRGQVGTNGPWGGMGGGTHRGTGPGSGSGNAKAAKQASELMDDYSFLSIAQTDTMVRVTSDSGRLLALYSSAPPPNSQSNPQSGSQASAQSGSQGSSQSGPQGGSQGNSKPADTDASKTSTTRMQGDQLVVVSTRDGVKTTRTYVGSSDGSQLNLTTRIEGGHLKDPVTIRFVYDPARAGDDDTE
jgi:hypothetical protein